jgi:hypothetical protein
LGLRHHWLGFGWHRFGLRRRWRLFYLSFDHFFHRWWRRWRLHYWLRFHDGQGWRLKLGRVYQSHLYGTVVVFGGDLQVLMPGAVNRHGQQAQHGNAGKDLA